MTPFYFLLYTFLLTLYLAAFSAKGKVISIKRSHNEVVVDSKNTNVHANITNTFHSKDKGRWNRSIFVYTKRQHRHLKELPPFNVIKCIVENMWLKKADEDSSATKQSADFIATMDVGKLRTDSICRIRYRRHQRVMKSQTVDRPSPTDGSDRRLADKTYLSQSDATKSIPPRNANCSVISEFLSNLTNLNFIRQRASHLSCLDDDMSALFDVASKLTDVRLTTESHRVKSVRRWRHLSCRLYHRFLRCLPKEATSSSGAASLSQSNSETTTTTTATKDLFRTSAAGLGSSDKEAVHVSDSSHIDFLNFMIGYNPDDNDDYQMWFY